MGTAICNHTAATAVCYREATQLAKRKDEAGLNVLQASFILHWAALQRILKK